MKTRYTVILAMFAGAAMGASAIQAINAQQGPGAYAIVDIAEVSDPNLFKTLGPKAGPANEAFGGKFIVRTEAITPLDGTPPKRIVVIAFDSIEKAKAMGCITGTERSNRHPTEIHQVAILHS
jgi:uncharacterized protein (DUF1330 family)